MKKYCFILFFSLIFLEVHTANAFLKKLFNKPTTVKNVPVENIERQARLNILQESFLLHEAMRDGSYHFSLEREGQLDKILQSEIEFTRNEHLGTEAAEAARKRVLDKHGDVRELSEPEKIELLRKGIINAQIDPSATDGIIGALHPEWKNEHSTEWHNGQIGIGDFHSDAKGRNKDYLNRLLSGAQARNKEYEEVVAKRLQTNERPVLSPVIAVADEEKTQAKELNLYDKMILELQLKIEPRRQLLEKAEMKK